MIKVLYEKYLAHHQHISTDTRNIIPGALFFALKGPNFNGNEFSQAALAQGASYAIVDAPQYKTNDRCILVDDVLITLQKLARHHRQQCHIPVIAITGSSGKTTTKELLYAILCQRYHTVATRGNLNNHIGVPLTLLSIRPKAEMAIVEMGANHIGEITALCNMALPTHGLITNIGHMHLQGFGSFDGVIRGKSELYHYLIQHDGQAFINNNDTILNNMAKRFKAPLYYPQANQFYHCKFVSENPYVVYQSENKQVVVSQLLGKHHFENIAAALCIGKYFKIDETKANEAMQNYQPQNNRSQIIRKGTNTIVLDAYNANLAAMQEMIRVIHVLPNPHKVLILGDMLELGTESVQAHETLGALTTQKKYTAVIFCGSLMRAAKKVNPLALYFKEKKSLAAYLQKQTFAHTTFLIKASRALGFESLVECINA